RLAARSDELDLAAAVDLPTVAAVRGISLRRARRVRDGLNHHRALGLTPCDDLQLAFEIEGTALHARDDARNLFDELVLLRRIDVVGLGRSHGRAVCA